MSGRRIIERPPTNKVHPMALSGLPRRLLTLCASAALACMLAAHELRRWIRTRDIVFEQGAILDKHALALPGARARRQDG
jgi:hypothetical protein